jgi:hypothetical protein
MSSVGPPYASAYLAEPINGMFITPWPEEGDDHCLYCAREIRLAPLPPGKNYWFHLGTFHKNCLRSELIRLGELELLLD